MILVHVSKIGDLKYLDPSKTKEKAICFTANMFHSYFGDYLYLFDYATLSRHFRILKSSSSYVQMVRSFRDTDYSRSTMEYRSRNLDYEYIIEGQRIDIRYAIGVIKHWNWTSGEKTIIRKMEEKIWDIVKT